MTASSQHLDKLESKYTTMIESYLKQESLCIESGVFADAWNFSSMAATTIRFMKRLKRERRGKPRERVARKVSYYSTWQTALAGRIKVVESDYESRLGFILLDSMVIAADELQQGFPDDPEYKQLYKRISHWRDAARRGEVGMADI